MNILTAIWAFLKNLYKSDTKGGVVLEMIKIIFSIVVSYFLYHLMLGFTTIPIRDYRIAVDNMMNINQKDKICLNINIDYGGNKSNYYRKDLEYGVSLDLEGVYEIDDSTNVKGTGSTANSNFDWLEPGKNFFKLFPKDLEMDTISVIYLIATRQFEIPNPNYKAFLFKSDTTRNYKNWHEKYDKTKGSLDSLRTYIASTSRMDTDKVNNIYQFKSQGIMIANEGGHKLTLKPAQALEFSQFNLVSLSDISQSDYHICIRLPKQVAEQRVNIDFGGATEFSEMQPEPDGKNMTGFYYTDRSKINQLYTDGLWFHAKFYQLENIQMIRLFFLTTVLGIMLGLLLSSVWNLIKIVMDSIIK